MSHASVPARAEWLPEEQSESAVGAVGTSRITFPDLTDHICGAQIRSAVTGGMVTYLDGSHPTATFARTLGRYLGPSLRRVVAAGR